MKTAVYLKYFLLNCIVSKRLDKVLLFQSYWSQWKFWSWCQWNL